MVCVFADIHIITYRQNLSVMSFCDDTNKVQDIYNIL
jgi:hypothetical protein